MVKIEQQLATTKRRRKSGTKLKGFRVTRPAGFGGERRRRSLFTN